ncbi:hypothetical protein LCGC14_0750290 [marine sediment metagenome]|uniref:Uncharacterized protein n=1 Tax=marine sediment metagenome TaxID=412755 RepID=A0A0F9SPB7_9ZZZZ
MRKILTPITLILGGLLLAVVAYAQPEAPPAETPDTVTPALADAAPAQPEAEVPDKPKAEEPKTEPGSNPDLFDKGKKVKGAVDDLRGDSDLERKFLIAALIAALANLLLSGIKRGMKLTSRGKKWLPRVALGLGVVVGVATYFIPGHSLVEALIYGGGPPGAIIIQEVFPWVIGSKPGGSGEA